MKKKFISLNVKFFLIALAVAIIPAGIVGGTMYYKSIESAMEKQEYAAENFMHNIADTISVVQQYVRSVSLNIISDNQVRGALLLKVPPEDVRVKRQNEISEAFFFYTGLVSYIDGIYLKGNNGIETLIGKMDTSYLDKNLGEVQKARGGAVWKWVEEGTKNNLYLLREIRDKENPSVPLGYMQILVRSDVIEEQLRVFLETFPGYVALCDRNGSELIRQGELTVDMEDVKDLLCSAEDFNSIKKKGMILYCNKIASSQWTIVSGMQSSDLFAENEAIKLLFLTIIASTLVLSLGIVYMMAKLITQPLIELTEQTKKITEEDYDIHLNIFSNDEFGILAENFNYMAERLDELVNEELRNKVLLQEAQFNALQAQINPHFLYNNLDTAYWMSRMEKAEKTGKILLALSALYRSAARSGNKIITVEEEVKYAQDYITIQELRLGNQIQFELKVEDATKECLTVRFILQPLIENSIEHGILPGGMEGHISIRIYADEEFLYFEVKDSGMEVSAEEITKILQAEKVEGRRGMAIRNIHQRIQIQYGMQFGLTFSKIATGGISTIVRQPAVKKTT